MLKLMDKKIFKKIYTQTFSLTGPLNIHIIDYYSVFDPSPDQSRLDCISLSSKGEGCYGRGG